MSSAYDFIINKEGDTFGNNLLLNPEAEGISPPGSGTISPWLSGSVDCTCVFGGVGIYGDFVFKIPSATPGSTNTLNQSVDTIPFTSDYLQVFGFFYSKSFLSVTLPKEYIKVSILYREDNIIDLFYLPINAALTNEYAGEVSGLPALNFYLAKGEFKIRKDKTIYSMVVTVANSGTRHLYGDNFAIRLNTSSGAITRSVHNDTKYADKYGVDSEFVDKYKNVVWNSSFELYNDVTKEPNYWTGGESAPNPNFDNTYRLKLETSQSSIQSGLGVINPSSYGGGKTRVSFLTKK